MSVVRVQPDNATIGRLDPGDWPFLGNDNWIYIYPQYTRELAEKLANADADVAAAVNAALDAQQAATDAINARDAILNNTTDWVDLPLSAGRAHIGDNRLQYRRHVGKTELRGGITNAGLTANGAASVGQLPWQFAPVNRAHGYAIPGNSGAVMASLMVLVTGEVQIRVGPTLGSYYLASGVSFDPQV